MFFYQHSNSNRPGHLQIDLYDHFVFPMHLHGDLELAYPRSGAVRLMLHGREELLSAGSLAVILPHELHGYADCGDSQLMVCVFSGDYVPTFVQSVIGLRSERSVADCTPGLRAYLDETFLGDAPPDLYQCKAALYAACAQYRRSAQFTRQPASEDTALEKLICYVEANYRESITLATAARALGYHASYLSRCFHQATGLNFRQFVNYQRVQCVCRDRLAHDGSLTELALQSGFQTLRSFNRAFLAFFGMPPREYFARQERRPGAKG